MAVGTSVTAIAIGCATILGSAQSLRAPAPPPPYTPVSAERLKKPADGDWLMVRRTYDGWGYSPLTAITPGNVRRLQPAWVLSTGVTNGHEAAPIVNNGVMFVATPGNQVIAIDAKSGRILWRYRRPLPEDVILLHPTSRGVALYGDKVFFAAGARCGRRRWKTTGTVTTCLSRRWSRTAK
jgi:alcohol dehydrogenase (cytochrome c)